MLRIYLVALSMSTQVGALAQRVERRDPNLATQLRRAATSVVLNIGEGIQSQGRNRNACYFNAMGSAVEVHCALDCAVALGYVQSLHPETRASLE